MRYKQLIRNLGLKQLNNTTHKVLSLISVSLMTLSAQASNGNIATTFGLLPSDMASSQAFSLFNDQVSASYYNPAALTLKPQGELSLAALHAKPSLTVDSLGGANPPVRFGDVLESEATKTFLFGMKTNLTSMTRLDHPVYLSLIAGVEDYGTEMLAFNSETSNEGQFMQYGQKPLFVAVSGATNIIDGLALGFGARLTLEASAELELQTDLAGVTEKEKLQVNTKPVLVPLFGLHADMSTLLCEQNADCFWSDIDLAFSYRGESSSKASINTAATIPGTVSAPGIPLIINTIDAYQPMITSFGMNYQLSDTLSLAATLEYQFWSSLTDELKKDTIKDQAALKFDDTLVPRLGVRYQSSESLALIAGLSVESSPLKTTVSDSVNLFDNDRIITAFGFSYKITESGFFAYPVQIDGAYQYHQLQERDFTLSTNGTEFESVKTEGSASVLSLSMSILF